METSHNIRVNNIIAEIRRRSSLNGGMYQPLVIKTPLRKGPYGEALHNIQKEDYFDCKFPEFLDIIRRPVNVPKWLWLLVFNDTTNIKLLSLLAYWLSLR